MGPSHSASPAAADQYRWVKQDCPICAVPPTRKIGRRGGSAHREGFGVECDVWQCGNCSLIFPNPMPVPIGGLDQHYSVDAEEYFAAHQDLNRRGEAEHLLDEAERLAPNKGKLLDIGVGFGEILLTAADRGWKCEGVEPSPTFADHVEELSDARIWRKPIEDCDLQPGSFDVVILSAVLEHLYDPDTVLAKIVSSLKPGGLLYLDVPNEHGLFFKIGNAYQRMRGRDWCVNLAPTFSPFHIFGFSPRSLKMLLSKHGLQIKTWRVYGGTSLVPSRGGIVGQLESAASKAVTAASNVGEMGTYIQAWCEKK